MNRALIGIGAVAVTFAILLLIDVREKNKLSEQITSLKSQLSSHKTQDLAALQEKCAQQSELRFHRLGYSENSQGPNMATYANHYNPAFSKCFMTIETTALNGAKETITRVLFDAYEQREYAEYFWISSETKKYWEQPPIACKMMPSPRDENFCKSEEEYKAFVARYME